MFRFRNLLAIASMAVFAIVSIHPLAAEKTNELNRFEQAPLAKEPKSPDEMFEATIIMVDLIRLDLAAKYLEQFDNASPDDETLIRLRDKHGIADFLKLARIPELQPRSTQLLDRMSEIAKKQAEDPAFIDGLLRRLMKGSTERELAIADLRNAGVKAVPEMLKQMSTPDIVVDQDAIVIALTKMGNQVIPPLIGALESPDDTVRAAIIGVLGTLDAREAIPYLWSPAFDESQPGGVRAAAKKTLTKLLQIASSKSASARSNGETVPDRIQQGTSVEASNELRRLAKFYFRKPESLPVNEEGRVVIWNWERAAGTVVEQAVDREIAALALSSRFAHQALSMSPEQPELQQQYLASIMGIEVVRNGWDAPRLANPGSAMYLALTTGESTVSHVLAESLEAGQPATAVAALEALSQIGTREQLLPQSGLKSPVIAALNSPDPRVQFAAATTVLKLDPTTAFNSSSRVVAILTRAINDTAHPRAIVIDGDASRGTITSGYLFDGGYEATVTLTGREGFELASSLAGVEVVVVHVNCARWELPQMIANLRADARTAAIPTVIYGPASLSRELSRTVARSGPATYVTESASSGDFLSQVRPFLSKQKTPPLSNQERSLQKSTAIYWLSTIGTTGLSRIFEISQAEKDLSVVVEDPQVGINALLALGTIATAPAQRRITEVVLNPQLDETLRVTAANQLSSHVLRHGLLLTNDQVQSIQAGWKNTDNPRVKSAIAAVIGSLHPSPQAVGERLRQFPIPPIH